MVGGGEPKESQAMGERISLCATDVAVVLILQVGLLVRTSVGREVWYLPGDCTLHRCPADGKGPGSSLAG